MAMWKMGAGHIVLIPNRIKHTIHRELLRALRFVFGIANK